MNRRRRRSYTRTRCHDQRGVVAIESTSSCRSSRARASACRRDTVAAARASACRALDAAARASLSTRLGCGSTLGDLVSLKLLIAICSSSGSSYAISRSHICACVHECAARWPAAVRQRRTATCMRGSCRRQRRSVRRCSARAHGARRRWSQRRRGHTRVDSAALRLRLPCARLSRRSSEPTAWAGRSPPRRGRARRS